MRPGDTDSAHLKPKLDVVDMARLPGLLHGLVTGVGAVLLVILLDPRNDSLLMVLTISGLLVWMTIMVAMAKRRRMRLGYWLLWEEWQRQRKGTSP